MTKIRCFLGAKKMRFSSSSNLSPRFPESTQWWCTSMSTWKIFYKNILSTKKNLCVRDFVMTVCHDIRWWQRSHWDTSWGSKCRVPRNLPEIGKNPDFRKKAKNDEFCQIWHFSKKWHFLGRDPSPARYRCPPWRNMAVMFFIQKLRREFELALTMPISEAGCDG